MSDEWGDYLSSNGSERRSDILKMAIAAGKRRRVRRVVGRSVPVVAVMIIAATMWPRIVPVAKTPVIARREPASAPASIPGVTFVEADPTIVQRLAVKPEPPRWVELTDGQLLDELAAAGRPAGIARLNGEAKLLWADGGPR